MLGWPIMLHYRLLYEISILHVLVAHYIVFTEIGRTLSSPKADCIQMEFSLTVFSPKICIHTHTYTHQIECNKNFQKIK